MSGYFRPWEITSVWPDCLVADAVPRNPSPGAEFPANKKKTGNFLDLAHEPENQGWNKQQYQIVAGNFPVLHNRELFASEQGICFQ
jgi:hypothetical protein